MVDRIVESWFNWGPTTHHYKQSSFSQIDKIGNNGNIGIRDFTMQKKSSDKMLPPVGLEPRQPMILSPTLSFLH